jgi:RND family efflux transporter MFP subunit
MKKILITSLVILGIAVIAALAYFGNQFVNQHFAQAQKRVVTDQAIDVIVAPVAVGDVTEVRTYNANISPMYAVDLMPQIQGRLDSLMLKRGDEVVTVSENTEVEQGEIIATLDYAGLKADWDKAESDYRRALRTEEFMKSEMERQVGLYKQESTTEQQKDTAIYNHDLAVEDVNQKRAVADQAKWRYEQAFLKAPFDGVVSKVYVDLGATVGPGMPVLRLVDLAQLKVVANVPNRYIGGDGIRGGVTTADITLEGGLGVLKGEKVNKIYAENEKTTRTNPVEIIIANEKILNPQTNQREYKVRGNMYASVSFHVRIQTQHIRIQSDAVIQKGDETYVFVVDKDNIAHSRKVETGIWEGPYMEIVDGLQPGEILVLAGQTKLVEGTKVNIVKSVAPDALLGAPAYKD